MMTTKCMITLVMMKLIILMILKVYADDITPLSYTSTLLPIGLHSFQLDNEGLKYSHYCIRHPLVRECINYRIEEKIPPCFIARILNCLFKDKMHPKDYPISLEDLRSRCISFCYLELKTFGLDRGTCVVDCYKEHKEKHWISILRIDEFQVCKRFPTTSLVLSHGYEYCYTYGRVEAELVELQCMQ
jgi:hypothetical protein